MLPGDSRRDNLIAMPHLVDVGVVDSRYLCNIVMSILTFLISVEVIPILVDIFPDFSRPFPRFGFIFGCGHLPILIYEFK